MEHLCEDKNLKTTKNCLAIILSLIITVSACIPVYAQEKAPSQQDSYHFENIEIESINEYKAFLLKFSRSAVTTEQFLNFFNVINKITRFITGKAFYPEDKFNITVDDFVQDMNNHINSKTGVDLVAIAQNLPDISKPTDFVATTFNLDTAALRNEMYI